MHRFIDGEDRMQQALLPHSLEDYVGEENPVRVIEVFIDELDLAALGFAGMTPAATGRPAYHPSTLLKIYLYGYLNRVPSSRRLERETQRLANMVLNNADAQRLQLAVELTGDQPLAQQLRRRDRIVREEFCEDWLRRPLRRGGRR